MTNLEIANNAIRSMSMSDLKTLTASIKARYAALNSAAKSSVMIGDLVSFNARANHIIVGRVVKINVKTVIVRPNNGGPEWKVSPSLLKPVKEMNAA